MKEKKGVIVLGGHVQGLGVVRIFGKQGIPSIVVDNTAINVARHSRYCSKFYKYKNNDLLEFLLYLGRIGKYKNWLIIPTNDNQVEIISKNYRKLEAFFKISTDKWEVLKVFFNKRLTYQMAEKLGIKYPDTFMPDSLQEVKQLKVAYPCIIKPAVMHSFYKHFKTKVFVCNNKDELMANYRKSVSFIPVDEIIIQEIIPGSSQHQYSVCFMFDGNKSLVSLVGRRARQHPPDFGNATTYAETVQIPLLYEEALRLLKAIGYTGVCEVEFKFDERDQQYKLLEVNPRTWKWHSITEKSNSPLLMSCYHFFYGLEPIEKNDFSQASFRHLVTDIPTMINMRLKRIPLSKTRRKPQYAVWDRRDLKPGLFELFYLPYNIKNR